MRRLIVSVSILTLLDQTAAPLAIRKRVTH